MGADPIAIHVISDSTGDTASRVARAAGAQFTEHPTRIVKHPRIVTAAGLTSVFERISACRHERITVFSTLVDDGLRDLVAQRCGDLDIPCFDLLGPALDALEQASGDRAERVVARPVGIDSDYFQRIAAMEFAVKHDDGQHPEGLKNADIVLVGISRTGKTPLSMYLGYLGYRTANVPLVTGLAPPAALFEVDRFRLVALTIDPQRLAAIRSLRVRSIARAEEVGNYAELPAIFKEVDHASAVQRTLRCPVIDTTTLALEEAARRVIDVVEQRRAEAQPT
ncbi:MAG: phosphoenolpyruvate synthase regulatory protein [Actinobacteria bacterium 69-20]|jgi:regulator of PEP synthase PpsR (kinase-PPPase family)|nr:kinase/pyrophosphorylase [Actinomycetota bacterium]OJV23968.1 MAG: phosphoenolpyruvate synthase regulatory protein [Actinobacteria bacterium 69-20]